MLCFRRIQKFNVNHTSYCMIITLGNNEYLQQNYAQVTTLWQSNTVEEPHQKLNLKIECVNYAVHKLLKMKCTLSRNAHCIAKLE